MLNNIQVIDTRGLVNLAQVNQMAQYQGAGTPLVNLAYLGADG